MKKTQSFILGGLLTLIFLPALLAQATAKAPVANEAGQGTSAAAAVQAPDDATRKLTELVDAGKYAEAQQLTTGLLVAYPTDQRLIKAKALIEKLVSAAGSASATPGSNQPINTVAPAQPALNASAAQLTGMDKVEYNSLIELARQAQQTTNLEQQNALLKQFMDKSHAFLQKYRNEMLLWQLRAASALSLNDMMAGYEAGQRLLAAGAADSNDSNLQQLLSKLNLRGWLDKEKIEAWRNQQADAAEAARLKAENDKYTFAVLRGHGLTTTPGRLTINDNNAVYDGSDVHIAFSKNDVREITYNPSWILRFALKNGKSFTFVPDTYFEEKRDGALLAEKVSMIMNAVVERWSFVPTDGDRSLVFSKKKTFKPTTPN